MLRPCASVAVLGYTFFLWLLNQILRDTTTLACFNTSVEEMCTSIIFPDVMSKQTPLGQISE